MPHNNGHDNETRAQSSNTTPSVASPKEKVATRLREAGLSVERFVVTEDGTKTSYDHTWHRPNEVENGYGVYAGRGLVFIDVDPYDVEELPAWLDDLPRTFTTKSPHGGEHRYFAVDGEVKNQGIHGGSIRADNQYVVGPGTTLTSCNREWHDCSKPDEGHYKILQDAPIAQISTTSLPERDENQEQRDEGENSPKPQTEFTDADVTSLEEIEAPFDRLETRLRVFLDDEIRKALWVGRYSDAGFNDHSDAERALIWHLGWFFESDLNVVGQLMNFACSQHQTTGTGDVRKWNNRLEGYRETTLELPEYTDLYEPPTPKVGPRPEVSYVLRDQVILSLQELYPATVDEVAAHERVDCKRRQVRNALNELIETNMYSREKDTKRPNNPYIYFPDFGATE